jgi:hypothetical protein
MTNTKTTKIVKKTVKRTKNKSRRAANNVQKTMKPYFITTADRQMLDRNSQRARAYKKSAPNVSYKNRKNPASGAKKSIKDAYVMCRLNPFHSMGGTGVPDGSQIRRLLVDHRMINTFTFGSSGKIDIAITPSIPNSVWANNGGIGAETTQWQINGVSYLQNESDSRYFVPLCQPEWRSQAINRYATTGNYNTIDLIYHSDKFRIVSVGWAITYIGNAMNNSGVMVISNASVDFSPVQPNIAGLTILSSTSGTNPTIGADQIYITSCNLSMDSTNFGVPGPAGRSISMQMGAHGLLKHSTSDYKYLTVNGYETYPVISGGTTTALLMQTGSSLGTIVGNTPVQLGFDPDWDTTLISISGGSVGQSFMLDTIYCIEYCPTPSSQTYPLASQPPKAKPSSITFADKLTAKIPVAVEGGISAISSAASVVSSGAMIAEFAGLML